ncbi:hypothetical protein [Streptomyces sp. NPDC056632]|uniref:hypothetical protein n=1 Tax=Streptomyces sp. NPDC056632 TaxID=3345884 RepID=UPI0036AE9EC2
MAARVTDTKSSANALESNRSDDEGDAKAAAGRAVRYFQVPVATAPTAGGASGYAALAMPAEVAAPERIQRPPSSTGPCGRLCPPTRARTPSPSS